MNDKDASSNLWWRDGVVYQIYPRSFADDNADGLGDLNGITSRLDYLVDLGIDAIWLSPIYPSPDADFSYDVSDYTAIDPRFGTMEDFERFVKQAHNRGIKIILDLVLNHTSEQHHWFLEAKKGRENPYRNWYLWQDPDSGNSEPNNWQSIFGGKGWELDRASGQYYFHMFYKEQPDLNWRNPDVRKAMMDVFRFWLEKGVDGFRLDVFNVYFKHAAFPDNPPSFGLRGFERQQHLYDCDQPEMLDVLKEIREILDSYSERFAVGETFLSTPEKAAGYCGEDALHAAFNFKYLHCKWSPRQFLRSIQEWEHALSTNGWPTYVLSNHDVKRTATRYCRGEDDERLKVAAAMLLTQRGTPYLYYGEEIGMRDISVSREEIQDPVGKRFWPFYVGRDGCRSPMQWDSSAYAGFGESDPWLAVHPNYLGRNVEQQRKDPNSLYHFYRKLIRIRRETTALREGMFLPLTQEPVSYLAYLRKTREQTVLVALNFSRRQRRLVLGRELARSSWKLLLSNKREETPQIRKDMLYLDGDEACILLQE